MENHPIPQDVTGFKFKLIGSVTLKQFLYILGGGILACISFVLPISAFVKYPLTFLFAGIGTALAFVPIDGRPMDVMMKNFLKALPAENQYIFRKRGAEALILAFFTPPPITKKAVVEVAQPTKHESALDTKRALLYKTLKQAHRPDEKEQEVLTSINSYLHESSQPVTVPVKNIDALPTTNPTLEIVTPSVTIKAQGIDQKIIAPVPLPTSFPVSAPTPVAFVSPTPPQVVVNSQVVQNDVAVAPAVVMPVELLKETPVAKPVPQVQAVQQSIAQPLPPAQVPLRIIDAPAPNAVVPPRETLNVTSVTPEKSLKAGFPQLPDMPNIVLGIIKDPRGRVLPNILVEIMNQQGIPVRAFKTNALGQFAAATPLTDGEYIVALEDARKLNEFEQFSITLDGNIFEPLEIVSVDQREKLRRELFGSTSTAPQMVAGT